jgi:hypothetical protein
VKQRHHLRERDIGAIDPHDAEVIGRNLRRQEHAARTAGLQQMAVTDMGQKGEVVRARFVEGLHTSDQAVGPDQAATDAPGDFQ